MNGNGEEDRMDAVWVWTGRVSMNQMSKGRIRRTTQEKVKRKSCEITIM